MGLVIRGNSEPPDAISPDRRLTSAKGLNTKPMMKGPRGTFSFSNKKPKRPNPNMIHTSKKRLFRAKVPMMQNTKITGINNDFGTSTSLAIP